MPSTDFTVAFHIGAHKTATSHLQRSLLKASDALADVGVRYYGPDYFRLPGRAIPRLFGLNTDKDPAKVKRSPQDQLRLMRKGASRLVLSEENYVGVLNSPRRLPVKSRYPDAAGRVGALAKVMGRDIDVFVCLRRPTAFINSAYCQMLMGGRVMPMARYKDINPTDGIDWLDLMRRLRHAPGIGELTVWRYEDYTPLFNDICAGLVGADHGHLVTPLPRRIHVGLSSPAVAEVLHRHAQGDGKEMGFAARKILPIEEGYPPFDGFTQDEHSASKQVYDDQIAAIAAMAGVTFLRPEPD